VIVLQTTKHCELLNYSEHGTAVDNILYFCDFSEKLGPPQPPPRSSELNSLGNTICEIFDKKVDVQRNLQQEAEDEVTPHPSPFAHSPDLSPSYHHLFGLVKDALHGCHFAYDNKLKQSFCDLLQSLDREFYNIGRQCLTAHWEKCVENDGELWKNSSVIAKDA
jgi:hypothetical protein